MFIAGMATTLLKGVFLKSALFREDREGIWLRSLLGLRRSGFPEEKGQFPAIKHHEMIAVISDSMCS